MLGKRIGIDLGTTSILVYVPKKGIIINEPAVVALETGNEEIMAYGYDAKMMLGRTPESIIAAYPLQNGVIANFKITQSMLKYYIDQILGRFRLVRPEILVAIPAGVTSTEKRAVIDATIKAGAKNAYVIKEPIAAALGAGIPISSPSGNMVIDIGGGTTEVAVISLGDIVASTSVRVGGNRLDNAIVNYIRKKYNLVIGSQTAEEIKIKIGSAIISDKEERTYEVTGCNGVSGLPESVLINYNDIPIAIKDDLNEIILAVKSVLQKTPPELASDVMDKGIIITGGSGRLRNLEKLLTKITGVPCQVAEDPELCVVKGTGLAVEHLDDYKKSVLWIK